MANNNVTFVVGTPIVLADATDYSPTAARKLGDRTHQIDVSALAGGAGRQSDKIDLGATRAMIYDVRMNFEALTGGDFTAGGTVRLYASPSHSGTANVGNVAYCTGSDAAYAAVGGYTFAELLTHLQLIGAVPVAVTSETDGPQSAHVGLFFPTSRYVNIVVVNYGVRAFPAAAIEFAVLFEPIITQIA